MFGSVDISTVVCSCDVEYRICENRGLILKKRNFLILITRRLMRRDDKIFSVMILRRGDLLIDVKIIEMKTVINKDR